MKRQYLSPHILIYSVRTTQHLLSGSEQTIEDTNLGLNQEYSEEENFSRTNTKQNSIWDQSW